MKRTLVAVACTSLLLLGACNERNEAVPESPETSAQTPASPAADIPALMKAAHVPGLAIATIDDCKLKDVSYYGVEDIDTQTPVGPDTLFEAASLTKTLFALIVMQLVDEGVIDLDKPLAETFAYPRIKDQESYALLTPRIILTHRTGFPNWAGDPLDPKTWGDIPFKNPPGEKFGYSGEGYQLLQAYVEDATGKTLDELFDERLGAVMPSTSLSAPKEGMTPAYGHDEEGGKGEHGRPLKTAPHAGAAFSGLTTARDYANFLLYLCRGGGLKEETLAEMVQPQSPTSNPAVSWGLGWGVQTQGDNVIYFHWGDNGQFKGFTAFNPETRDGLVFFANGINGLKLIEPLAEPVVGDLDPAIDWLDYGRLD